MYRLTHRINDEIKLENKHEICEKMEQEPIVIAMKKLADYEDAEEQGKLIVLPYPTTIADLEREIDRCSLLYERETEGYESGYSNGYASGRIEILKHILSKFNRVSVEKTKKDIYDTMLSKFE